MVSLMQRRREMLCQSQGPVVAYEASNLVFNGSTDYVDTGVYLFSEENINKDFRVTLTLNCPTQVNALTIVCAKYDTTPPPGFLMRPSNSTDNNYKGTINFNGANQDRNFVITRIGGVITVTGDKTNNPEIVNEAHPQPLMLGCALQTNNTRYRYCKGTVKYIKVEWL